MSGSFKALFPRGERLEAVLLNTSGGLTGGDRLRFAGGVGTGSALTVTTQAAERAYRSISGSASMRSRVEVEAGSTLHWLPQETILFDGCDLTRSLQIDLAGDARLLMVEPVIFGRAAMGEVLTDARFCDDIHITRAGQPLYTDRLRLQGDLYAQMARPAIGGGAGAMVSLVYVAPDAEAHLPALRRALPDTGGASLIGSDLLVMRLLAPDSFALRRVLVPLLDRLTGQGLPKVWRL